MDIKAKTGIGAVILVIAAHTAGALRAIEREVSPRLAAWSLDIFHVSPELGLTGPIAAAKSIIINSSKNKYSADYIAARAACAFLNANQSLTLEHAQLVAAIDGNLSPSDQSFPGVQYAVSKLANVLQGATTPGSYGQIYRQACFGKY